MLGERAFQVTWNGLTLLANCSESAIEVDETPAGRLIWGALNGSKLDPWSVAWWVTR